MSIFPKHFNKYLSLEWVARNLHKLSAAVDAIADAVLPDEGETNAVLMKYSNEDFAARWVKIADPITEDDTEYTVPVKIDPETGKLFVPAAE